MADNRVDYDYHYYVDFVENKYFHSVDQMRIDTLLECFCEDAVFTIQSAHSTHSGRDREIKQMFLQLFKNYAPKIIHKDFRHVVDVMNKSCASQFKVENKSAIDGHDIFMSNCNFFYFEDGRIKEVYVYMSDGHNTLG